MFVYQDSPVALPTRLTLPPYCPWNQPKQERGAITLQARSWACAARLRCHSAKSQGINISCHRSCLCFYADCRGCQMGEDWQQHPLPGCALLSNLLAARARQNGLSCCPSSPLTQSARRDTAPSGTLWGAKMKAEAKLLLWGTCRWKDLMTR